MASKIVITEINPSKKGRGRPRKNYDKTLVEEDEDVECQNKNKVINFFVYKELKIII